MEIVRPQVRQDTYDKVIKLAQKNSQLQINDFESAVRVLLQMIGEKA